MIYSTSHLQKFEKDTSNNPNKMLNIAAKLIKEHDKTYYKEYQTNIQENTKSSISTCTSSHFDDSPNSKHLITQYLADKQAEFTQQMQKIKNISSQKQSEKYIKLFTLLNKLINNYSTYYLAKKDQKRLQSARALTNWIQILKQNFKDNPFQKGPSESVIIQQVLRVISQPKQTALHRRLFQCTSSFIKKNHTQMSFLLRAATPKEQKILLFSNNPNALGIMTTQEFMAKYDDHTASNIHTMSTMNTMNTMNFVTTQQVRF